VKPRPNKDISDIKTELTELSAQLKKHVNPSIGRMVGMGLIKGMAFGFGSLIGATVLVSLAAYLLTQAVSQIDFFPLLQEWIGWVVEIIDSKRDTP
jgi:hypothetical protein